MIGQFVTTRDIMCSYKILARVRHINYESLIGLKSFTDSRPYLPALGIKITLFSFEDILIALYIQEYSHDILSKEQSRFPAFCEVSIQ